ncbi:hypothetical protein [Pendulispora albinea]|uniref:Uncharacterized protein n=1 Tax=Pendulispora albinea TaxID=2741071 RepID=A0ABZ2LP83_9BACT
MNKLFLRRRLLPLVTLTSLIVIAGCEIAVDFDRTKINPPPGNDSSVNDGAQPDNYVPPDTGSPDTGVDAGDAGDASADADADA